MIPIPREIALGCFGYRQGSDDEPCIRFCERGKTSSSFLGLPEV